jgi:dTDP-4-amino-4,6-dideoxygalactose transaminase
MIGRLSCVSGLRIAEPAGHIRHSYYKFYAFVEAGELARGWNRDRVAQAIAAEGVPCSTGSCSEIYLEAAFPPRWRPRKRLAIARELGECSLMFPVHPTLTDANVERVCDAVEKVMSMAARKRFVSGTDSSIETILPPA